jgi:DNA helicase-2/ATP-dependent DNA helicase PcrA
VLVPRPRGARKRSAAVLDTELDPAQRSAVTLPPGGALLVLGEAGHGKTTVAVHRFAHLWRTSARPLRAAAIVPAVGLSRLMQSLLRRLGADVEVLTYDAWARAQARRAFRDLPARESETLAPSVMRLKRDPALRDALAVLAGRAPAQIDDDRDARVTRSRALARRADLQHLFGDRVLLDLVARASGALTPRMVADTLEHTRVQFSPRAEREWSHVTDRARLVAVDGRELDDATATADAGGVDVEDYAVLFELDRMRAERSGATPTAPRAHDLVLVDEAQELAPLELALIGRSVAEGGSLIVAGDADQQTDATTSFTGWAGVMRELGYPGADPAGARPRYAVVRLEVGYRCPPDVAALARAIRDGGDVGAGVSALAFADAPELAARLAREIRAFSRRDPRGSVAIVCRSPRFARALATMLHGHDLAVRLVFDGAFLVRGPVQITTVEETKGLEFDVVIVPDASASDYPESPAARRALYVAVTRARHQVLLAHVGARTPLVPGG